MGLIDDVAVSVRELDLSPRRLRRFAFLVAAVLAAIALALALRGRHPGGRNLAAGAGAALVLAGVAFPARLAAVYRAWMALAFALGWATSRVVLFVLFALVLTPIALVARLTGKRFLDLGFTPGKDGPGSYWVRKEEGSRGDYEKMY